MTEEHKLQSPAPKQPIAPDLKAPAEPAPGKDAAEAAKLADKVHANA
jgi:hypothetical protein